MFILSRYIECMYINLYLSLSLYIYTHNFISRCSYILSFYRQISMCDIYIYIYTYIYIWVFRKRSYIDCVLRRYFVTRVSGSATAPALCAGAPLAKTFVKACRKGIRTDIRKDLRAMNLTSKSINI